MKAAPNDAWEWLDAVPTATLAVDQEGRIVRVNRQVTALLGHEESCLIGLPVESLVPEHQRAEHRFWREESAEDPLERPLGRARDVAVLSADGSEIPVEVGLGAFLLDGDAYTVATLIDLRRRRTDDERARHVERLTSMGRLAASVAHEINNPLSFISANLAVARRLTGGDRPAPLTPAEWEELRVVVRESQEGVARVIELARQLRTLARADVRNEPVTSLRLANVVRAACSMVRRDLTAAASYGEALSELPPIRGRETQLVQVVVNLLVNAMHAVASLPEGARKQIRVTTRQTAHGQELCVDDSGPGIPEALRDRVREPFFTTKPAGLGTGLGLSIVHETVSSHGGALRLESRPGGGCRAVVVLPELGGDFEARETPPAPAPAGRPFRILLVDDEPMIQRALTRLLRPHVVVGHDPEAALARLVDAGDRTFDLVLCDLIMPSMSGIEFHRRLGTACPELLSSFVLCSGGPLSADAEAFVQRENIPLLSKPASAESLIAAARRGRQARSARRD